MRNIVSFVGLSFVKEAERREPHTTSETAILQEEVGELDGPALSLHHIRSDSRPNAGPILENQLLQVHRTWDFKLHHPIHAEFDVVIHVFRLPSSLLCNCASSMGCANDS